MTRAATTLADPCTGEGATSYWACIVANSSGHMSHHGAQGTEWTLVAPNELARLASLHPVATRRLPRVQSQPHVLPSSLTPRPSRPIVVIGGSLSGERRYHRDAARITIGSAIDHTCFRGHL